ncbi:MAG: EAL domain-containing protein [Gammaproteobacteria bacterium]|nr:EAL domain-containing protein [Gammaproteobacteria bacterium]
MNGPRLFAALCLSLCLAPPASAQDSLRLAVFADRPKAQLQARWQPLANYLSEHLRGEARVELLVLDERELDEALSFNRVDLLLTNPSHYLMIRSRNSMTGALATVIRQSAGQATRATGGVIVRAAERQDIAGLEDLRGKRLAMAGVAFLGGYQAQAFELLERGIALPQAAELLRVENQDAVVAAVLDERADVGFVSTGLLETLVAEGRLTPGRLAVVNSQSLASFPHALSTRLYPEWPFLALPHVDEGQVRRIAGALLALEPERPAARAAGIAGFAPAADYLPVERLARRLRLPPYAQAPKVGWRDIWEQHRLAGLGLGLSLIVIASLLLVLARRNRQLLLADAQRAQALAAQNAILMAVPDLMFELDAEGRYLAVWATDPDMLAASKEALIGHTVAEILPTEATAQVMRALAEADERGGSRGQQIQLKTPRGAQWFELSTSLLDANRRPHRFIMLSRDITERREHQRQLEYIAHYDALTGLPNRVLKRDRLKQAMAQAQRRGQLLALAYLDLDGFKAINDRYGHDVGDAMLIALARRMAEVLRAGDTLARLGGDEFVVVLTDLHGAEECLPLFKRLLSAAAQPVSLSGHELQVTVSLGASFYPQTQDVDADQLVRQADQAMYQAKQAGKNRFQIYDTEQDLATRSRHEILAALRAGLAAGEFLLFYQPKVNMRTGQLVGAEALIRWQHPERGLLPPGLFLPVIEDDPLSVELGDWVIETALRQMEAWQAQGLDIPVSVNVSARQLQQSDFVERLRLRLADHPRIGPGRLELEVLETTALDDIDQISTLMKACAGLGVSFALDDFGTGYSSLTYLKRLPARQLKIDQSFVRDMLDDPDDLAILDGVLGLASAFRCEAIAEGVETERHGRLLLQLGCELAQGYGIARPMPAAELPGWKARWQPSRTWNEVRPVERENIALLFAEAELRAWLSELVAFVEGQRALAPEADVAQGRLGQWLVGAEQARYAGWPDFQACAQTLNQLAQLAAALLEAQDQGQDEAVCRRLSEIRVLKEELLLRIGLLLRATEKQRGESPVVYEAAR